MLTFIVNPHARSGLGQKVWDELEQILKDRNIAYDVHFTKYQKHATAIVNKLTSTGEENTIIALGGDGTVNEVVNGIANYSKTTFGYIPIGSSNDFARGLHIPADPKAALELILGNHSLHPMNIGYLEYNERHRNFATSSGIGFTAAICHEVVVSKLKLALNKIGLGKLVYVLIALNRLAVQKPREITVTLDDNPPVTFPHTYFVAMMNNPFEGGGFKFAPEAKNDDDMLDVVVASEFSKVKLLRILPTAYKGEHTRFKGIHVLRAKKVVVESPIPLALHTDGEPIYLQRKITVGCEKEKMFVITP